jgi:FG-GAP-like repeat
MHRTRSAALLSCFLLAASSGVTGMQGGTLPRFDRVLLLETTSETSANVSIGDVNGDGHLDIVLAKGRHWGLVDRVLLGDGAGRFPTAHDLGPASDRTYSGNLVDLDGDGDLDVVISNDTPDPKRIYLNDGSGHFREVDTYGSADWPTRNAAVADIDGDRLPDIIVANRTPPGKGANYICLNRGGGQFEDDCTMFAKESATTITPADFDRDGRMDLAVPHRDGGQSHIYLNKSTAGSLRFAAIPFGPPDATIRMSAAADLNRDGLIDIVVIDEKRGLFAFFGAPGNAFSNATPIGERGRTPYALTVADLNRDGAPDIVVGHVEAPATVFFNDRSGRTFTTVDFGDGKGTAYGFDIADLDKDGHLDIAMARSEAPNVVYFGSAGGTDKQRGPKPQESRE